jgi:murein L,D-transpeptidase YcbB/YkuD
MAFLRYATRLMEGRVPWARGEEDWHLPGERSDAAAIFRQLEIHGVPGAFDRFVLSHEPYTALRDAILEYRAVARAGGWPILSEGETLRVGDRSPRVRTLRRRLYVTGDLTNPDDSPLFDEEVGQAVRAFQARHGLHQDGSVGRKTLHALNVPVEDRLRQLQVNLERRRWLPPNLGEEFLWINVPEFRLRIVRGDHEVLSMPVVVGAPGSPTPSFAENLDRAVVNPSWYVPESIAVNELAPKAVRDPEYLTNANFDLLDEGGAVLDSGDLELDLLRSGRHRLRRRPGPENDLGRIKFLLPNPFHIYLHDTPSRGLFQRTSRAFSHGCIRVGEPLELAKYLFDDRFAELERDLQAGLERELKLEKPVPVYIVYFTAWQSADRVVHFRDDIYGRDEALIRQLWGGPAATTTTDAAPLLQSGQSAATAP